MLIALLIVELHCAVFPMFFVFAAPYIAEFVFLWLQDLDLDEKLFRCGLRIVKTVSISAKRMLNLEKLKERNKEKIHIS